MSQRKLRDSLEDLRTNSRSRMLTLKASDSRIMTLVILAMIGNHLVHRCLIDDGSSVDILYLDILEKMMTCSQSLRAAASPVYGFT